ncbi:MAG: glycosyltransferase family 39 protein [Chloroflexi bacterium]|nr:glycosyltransferase family 39 protein [Chloroflexota bacterium]
MSLTLEREIISREQPETPGIVRLYLLVTIIAAGFGLRTWDLDRVPPGLFFDVAANLQDVIEVREGARPIWFVRNNGREPLMIYAETAASLVLGVNALAARYTALVFGLLTIPALYLLGCELGRIYAREDWWIVGCVCAALGASGIYWLLNFSRLGLRVITLPLVLTIALTFTLRALRRFSVVDGAIAGTFLGGTLYTYTSARLLIPAIGIGALVSFGKPEHRGALLRVWLATAFAALTIAAPLLIYYMGHREMMDFRTMAVSISNPEVHGGDPWGALVHGVFRTALGVSVVGTTSAMENLPERALFDPLVSVGVVAGTLVVVAARKMVPATLLLLVIAATLAPAVLSVNPPSFSRLGGFTPIAAGLAALGFNAVVRALRDRRLLALFVIPPMLLAPYDYFARWAPSEAAYLAMMGDKVDVAAAVVRLREAGDRVFLAPLYARDFTFSFLLRDAAIASFDLGRAAVIPLGGERAHYVLPAEDAVGASAVAARLSSDVIVTSISGRDSTRPIAIVLTAEPGPPPTGRIAAFSSLSLVRVDVPAEAHGGETISVDLWWYVEDPVEASYTVFLHLRQGESRTLAQNDSIPGDASSPTSTWKRGDLVFDRHLVKIPLGSLGPARLVTGLYDAGSGRRVHLTGSSANEVTVAHVTIRG